VKMCYEEGEEEEVVLDGFQKKLLHPDYRF
jgi:hypothetical protein